MVWAFNSIANEVRKSNFERRQPPLWMQGRPQKVNITLRARLALRNERILVSRNLDFPAKIFLQKLSEINGEVPTSPTVPKTHITKKLLHPTPFLGVMM